MAELLLKGFAFGDVPEVDHHAPYSRVVEQLFAMCSKVAPRAILVRYSKPQGRVKPRFSGPRRIALLPVVRMNGADALVPPSGL